MIRRPFSRLVHQVRKHRLERTRRLRRRAQGLRLEPLEDRRLLALLNVPGDYPTIQDAVNDAQPGDEITINNGTFSQSVDLNLMGSALGPANPGNLTIRAVNSGSVTLNGGAGSAISGSNFSGDITIVGLNLDQNAGNPGGVIDIADVSGTLTLRSASFENFGGEGLRVVSTGTTDTTVQVFDSKFDNTEDNDDAIHVELQGDNQLELVVDNTSFNALQDDGIAFEADSAATGGQMTARLTNNTFTGRVASGQSIDLFIGNNSTVGMLGWALIHGNKFTGPATPIGDALLINIDGEDTVASVTVSDNTFQTNLERAIFVDSDSTAQGTTLNLLIKDNSISNTQGSGIQLRPFENNVGKTSVWNAVLTGNALASTNQANSPTDAGIEIEADSTQDDYVLNLDLRGNAVIFATGDAYQLVQGNGSTVNLDQGSSMSTDAATVIRDNNVGTPVSAVGTVNVVAGAVNGNLIPANLGDLIWDDLNGNGIRNAGEPGLAGVAVALSGSQNAGGSVNRSTVSDPNGNYIFPALLPGTYTVTVTPPAGYSFAPQFQGGDPTLDSNFDPQTGQASAVFTVNDLTIDAGLMFVPPATTSVGLDASNNLLVEDLGGGTTDDTISLSLNLGNIRVHDPNNALGAGTGATQVDNNTVDVPIASITGPLGILVDALGGDDLLTIDYVSGGFFALPITYSGGSQNMSPNGDRLVISGGTFTDAEFNYANLNDGDIDLDGTVITYTGLEPITATITAANVTLNYSNTAETITVTDAGGGQTTVSSTLGEVTTFTNPTGTLTINAGDVNDDTIIINSLAASYPANVVIDGELGSNDTITVNTALSGNGNLTLTAETINLNGGTVTTTGNQTYNNPVTLGANTTLNAGAGNISFVSTVTGAAFTLDANSTGTTTFGGAVNVASLTTNAGGTTAINGATVTTTGNQTYNDPVTLGANTTLNAGAGNISFVSTVTGAAFTLDANSTGTTTFGGAVNVASLTTNAGGTTAINGGTVTTTGNQTYNDPVTLGANTTLNAGAGNISFVSTVTGAAFTLDANSTGTTTFGGAVNVASLTTNAGGTTAINGGTVTTTGNQTYNDPVTLGANTTLNAGAGNISFVSTVTGAAFTLDANSTGTTTFGGAVNVASLTTNAGGTTAINGGTVTTTGNQTYNDPVTLGANTTLNAGAGNISFVSTVTGAAFTLDANSTGTTTFGGAVNVASLTTNAGGTTAINGGTVTTTGNQTYNDPVTLGANTTLNAGAGNISFVSTVTGAAFTLDANSTGTTTFGGAVNVASLTTNAGGTTAINGGTVTTTGNQTYNDPVTLGANTMLNAGAGNISFVSTVTGAAFTLDANSTGTTTFGGAVNVASLTTNAGGTTAINGGTVTTTGNQTYNDPVTLGANTTLNAGAGNISFVSTVTGAAFTLDANSTGTTTFGGAVNVASLTTNAGGTTAINGGTVTTTGNQTYNDPVTLGANTRSMPARATSAS